MRKLHASGRAYPLIEIASLFLTNPDFCAVRVESAKGPSGVPLYQCKSCGMTSLDRATATAHLLKEHLEEVFIKEESVVEPPSGHFVCVARCGITGTLLGPPNHNSYAEAVREIHDISCPEMSMDEYKNSIEMLRDPELIEEWREEARKKTVYRLREDSSGDAAAETMSRAAAFAMFLGGKASSMIAETRRAGIPAKIARVTEDTRLMQMLKDAWQKEMRFPQSLLFSLRGAFRHKKLHLFKAGKRQEFAISIKPCPLSPKRAVDSIREVLVFLQEHPGCTREALIQTLHPGISPESREAASILSSLSWLIEKGHIIEFFNGTLSVPLCAEGA